jgi:hypothetical protein
VHRERYSVMAGRVPIRESRNTQPLGVRFRATLGEEPKVELALV